MGKANGLAVRLALGSTVLLIALFMIFSAGLDLRPHNDLKGSRLVAQHTAPSTSVGSQAGLLRAGVQDIERRWFGSPTLWQPAPISGTTIEYFDVSGTTQNTIMDSFQSADICTKYGPCSTDPAVPNGFALGEEWFAPSTSSYLCYSPATTTLAFHEYVLLPRWSPRSTGGIQLSVVEAWNALLQSIYVHEAGHVAIDVQDIAALNAQAHGLASCHALYGFWDDPHIFDKLDADQAAYHARLHADCRPEIGCIPPGWMGW